MGGLACTQSRSGVVTCVAGGGCELDCFSFFNIGGDIDGINRGCEVGDGDFDGFGGVGSVVVSDADGNVMIAVIGKLMGNILTDDRLTAITIPV